MFVKLSTGEARVWVKFDVQDDGRRSTQITFEYQDKGTYAPRGKFIAIVLCSKQDNFCRRTGRKMALNKLLWDHPTGPTFASIDGKHFPSWLKKEDRKILWKAVCPEFKSWKQKAIVSEIQDNWEPEPWLQSDTGGEG